MNTINRSAIGRVGVGVLSAALLTSALVAVAPAAAAAPPAQSRRVLPDVHFASSAVGPDGSSLVFGEENSPGDRTRDGLRAYFRTANGTWRTSAFVLPKGGYPDVNDVGDTAVAAGTAGFFVLAWTMVVQGDTGHDVTVYATTRSPSGTIRKPTKVYTTVYPDQPGAPTAAGLRIAANDNGDVTLTQAEPHKVARYLRGSGWTSSTLADEAGQAPDNDATGEHKHAAIPLMSAARTVDVAYAYRPPGETDAIRQVTRVAGSSALTRRTLLTLPDNDRVQYGIARDSANLQTLAVTDGQSSVVVYRERTPRGSMAFQFDFPQKIDISSPHVASRGKYTRVTWRSGSTDGPGGNGRLYDGSTWSKASPTKAVGSAQIRTPLVIGADGRGVEASWYGGTGDQPHHAYRSALDGQSSTIDTITPTAVEPPALDVGRFGVSQYVVRVLTPSGVYRAVVNIRR